LTQDELPGGCDAEVVVPVVVVPVVDVEAGGVELADVHAVPVGVHNSCKCPSVSPKVETGIDPPLPPEFDLRVVQILDKTSPLETCKKFIHIDSHAVTLLLRDDMLAIFK
jgi:hypothetical protein